MIVGLLILAGLGAVYGAEDYKSSLTHTPYSLSSRHRQREILRLPGYSGPLPSRHYSGFFLSTQELGILRT